MKKFYILCAVVGAGLFGSALFSTLGIGEARAVGGQSIQVPRANVAQSLNKSAPPAAQVAYSLPESVQKIASPSPSPSIAVVPHSTSITIGAGNVSLSTSYPYELIIPKISTDARVASMGVTAQGRMAVPGNYTEAGWFNRGAAPGQPGSAVIGAHVDNGSSINGIFKKLRALGLGDVVYVRDQSGTLFKYVVRRIKVYDRNIKDTSEVFNRTGGSYLNLITCDGQWLAGENTYANRLVVFTELVETVSK